MGKITRFVWCLAVLLLVQQALRAVEISEQEFERMKRDSADLEQLKRDVADLRKKPQTPIVDSGACEKCLDEKFGPDLPVTTRQGKLTIGGMVQVWYYGFERDKRALFDNPNVGIADSNTGKDLNTFRVRRAELNLAMDIHEKVTSYVMVDFARDQTSFPFLEDNQGNAFIPKVGTNSGIGGVQAGGGFAPGILQDALVNFHDVVPHHDFTVGQYLPYFSQEDFLPNFMLDFVERSFVGNHFSRDLGATIHGTWWDNGGGGFYCGGGDNGRVQYWLSAFNGTSNYHAQEGSFQTQNRADDNADKDFLGTFMIRPLWKQDTWGSLEIGYAGGLGRHGNSTVLDPLNDPHTDGNRRKTMAFRNSGWLYYTPGGIAKGAWLKGEAASVYDRNFPGLLPLDLTDPASDGQSPNKPFETHGFYVAAGYRIQDTCGIPDWAKPFEIALRYQQYTNVEIVDPADATHTNVYTTKEWTPGINYFIKGHNAKIQANYNIMENPKGPPSAPFHNVQNNSFALNFQVMF